MSAGVWFRKCLRLHDNAALTTAAESSDSVIPFFILDPAFDRSKIGVNRFHFLLESLQDLDEQLRERYNSRLLVFRGKPTDVLRELFEGAGRFRLGSLFYERDMEPYARVRDAAVEDLARKCKVPTMTFSGHTILDVDLVVQAPGFKPPIAMSSIQNLVKKQGPIPKATEAPKYLPALKVKGYEVPDLAELYKDEEPAERHLMPGGEREALQRLKRACSDKDYIATFEKPKTESTGREGAPWEPSTTGLSPYIKFGCISVRKVWHAIDECLKGRTHSQPPMSLHGQLLFREMFYVLGASVPNLDKDKGNRMCKEIPWGHNQKLLAAWEEGKTGYPFIDALMRQLVQTGWMHHLGRHAVACFLTRGDLWQNWTAGRDVFDKYLLDSDWAINNGNWLWLAGVAPWSAPYFRIYDPCPGPKTSLNAVHSADFIRHFVPELKGMPDRFLLTPWKAPDDVQKAAQCILGKDYPRPVVDHKSARQSNLSKFKAALDSSKKGASSKLPEKFGERKGDPGPMRVTYSDKSATSVAESGQPGGGTPTMSHTNNADDVKVKGKSDQEVGHDTRVAAPGHSRGQRRWRPVEQGSDQQQLPMPPKASNSNNGGAGTRTGTSIGRESDSLGKGKGKGKDKSIGSRPRTLQSFFCQGADRTEQDETQAASNARSGRGSSSGDCGGSSTAAGDVNSQDSSSSSWDVDRGMAGRKRRWGATFATGEGTKMASSSAIIELSD